MKKYSQREAHRMAQRIGALERDARATWLEWRPESWPATAIAREPHASVIARTAIATARKLQCRVIVTVDGDDLVFFAKRISDNDK